MKLICFYKYLKDNCTYIKSHFINVLTTYINSIMVVLNYRSINVENIFSPSVLNSFQPFIIIKKNNKPIIKSIVYS